MCKKSQRKETVRLLGTGFTKPITETERQIVQEIIQENFVLHELSAADLICIDSYESKSKRGTYNVIFLASPTALRLYSAVEGRVRYFEDRISLSDYTSINSCMKCGSLEHTQTYCNTVNISCTICASAQHSFTNCPIFHNQEEDYRKRDKRTDVSHCTNCRQSKTHRHSQQATEPETTHIAQPTSKNWQRNMRTLFGLKTPNITLF